MKTTTLSALALVATALPLAAQTATTTTAKPLVHHTATTTHTVGGCATLPTLSPKIPAVPEGTPCPKVLYTLTRTPDVKLDYVSPLVGSEVRDGLATEKTTYSLLYADTKIGTGELVHRNKNLSVHYTGYLTDGTKFDSSVDRGQPITFPYGTHHVIQGWDTGFEGMRVGGKRRLYIPYQLAYGEQGRPPVIPAKALLVFDMEVVSQAEVPPPAPRPTPHPPVPPAGNKPATTPSSTAPASTTPASTPAATPATSAKPATAPASTTTQPASTTPKQ